MALDREVLLAAWLRGRGNISQFEARPIEEAWAEVAEDVLRAATEREAEALGRIQALAWAAAWRTAEAMEEMAARIEA